MWAQDDALALNAVVKFYDAFVTPGKQIVFTQGILPVLQARIVIVLSALTQAE